MWSEEINREIASCVRCPLCQSRTRVVPGEGPEDAMILLLGEAPGREEDETGRPFVGRSGRLLDECLAAAGIKRSDVFITNVVKCRPPDNRRPKRGEMESCRTYLRAQLELIDPRTVCLMGNVAARAVLDREGINALRGQVFEGRFIVTFHPAAIVRNRNRKDDLISDLKKARILAEGQEGSGSEKLSQL